MNLSFENKVALVTGAGSGMGLATAKAFAEAEAAAVLADVNVTSAPPMLFPEALASATVVPEAALLTVLLGAFLFHPVDGLAVELFLNGDVCHGRGRHGALLETHVPLTVENSSSHGLSPLSFLPHCAVYPPSTASA